MSLYATELRERASRMADAGSERITNTRDRMTSQPSKNIDWSAEPKAKAPPPPKKPKPPPPPARMSSPSGRAASGTPPPTQEQGKPPAPPVHGRRGSPSVPAPSAAGSQPLGLGVGPPPTIRRETRPDLVAPSPAPPPAPAPSRAPLPPPSRRSAVVAPPKVVEPPAEIDRIDWANLSPEDKQELFSWLDEFFARFLGAPEMPPRSSAPTVQHVQVPPGGHTPPPMAGPPKLPNMASRPEAPPRPALSASSSNDTDFTMSYPPPTERGSAAEDLAYYFHPSTPWPDAWYTSETDMMPPPLRAIRKHVSWTASWSSDGTTKTLRGGVLFSDLSMCWYAISWPQRAAPASLLTSRASDVRRVAQYLPRPAPWPRARLVDAHETYGETTAGFAESFEGGGVPCARGECWDLAHEALLSFAQYDYVPAPVPSIARTHGHLIYAGFARAGGRTQAGRWRGGDDRVRRGDVAEWRSVRVGMGPRAWAMLGDPEHTAVIVSDMVPRVEVADGRAVRPADMGTLEVVEQSVGKPPARARYDLANLEEGEVWIYRPVGLEAYVGAVLSPECPEGVNAISV